MSASSANRKGFPKPLKIFLALFFGVWVLVFVGAGIAFIGGVINVSSNPHQITIEVEQKEIVTHYSDGDSSSDFVITATVFDEDGEYGEMFSIVGYHKDVMRIYSNLRVGETYLVQVNGDPDKFRVLTDIVR